MKGKPVIVGIASGRRGAGRTTVGINLAAALATMGLRVGITDTETRGPVVPDALGAAEPQWRDGRLVPGERYGVQVVSFAYLIEEDEREQGRRPALADLAVRFEAVVAWDDPEVLLIALPSSATQSLIKSLRLDAVMIVATPQGAVEGATDSAVTFFRGTGVPILGLIENLSYYQCRQCRRRDAAEESGAVPVVAERLGVRYLGELPISIALRDCMDENCPVVVSNPELPEADMFVRMARSLIDALDQCADKSGRNFDVEGNDG